MECISPYHVKNKYNGEVIPVPCSKCPACYARRVSQWSFRLMSEEKVSTSAHFLTLTYDTKTVPISNNGFMSLSKRDLQLFFKRLRKANGQTKLRYYAVGEYGGKTARPHYHVILFNAAVSTIQSAWGLGHIHYGTVSGASIGYTLKYLSKASQVPKHKNDDRQKEKGFMSKGLGANYITPAMIRFTTPILTIACFAQHQTVRRLLCPAIISKRFIRKCNVNWWVLQHVNECSKSHNSMTGLNFNHTLPLTGISKT